MKWGAGGDRWPTVLRIPFGRATSELGLKTYRDQAPIVPSAFAVTDDGFWILDPQKRRLCLYDGKGRLVRSLPGVSQIASDLALDSEDTPIIINREPEGELLRLKDGRLRKVSLGWSAWRLTQTDEGTYSVNLKPTDQPGDPVEFVTMDGQSSGLRSRQMAADLAFVPEGRPGRSVVATNRWRRQFEPEPLSGADTADLLEDATLLGKRGYFRVSPGSSSRSTSQGANPQYLLELDLVDGRVVSYERIEQGALDDANQATYFAVRGKPGVPSSS